MQFTYDKFKQAIGEETFNQIEVIFIDKDLDNIALLKQNFPHTKLLICVFHVIKYFKTYIAKLPIEQVQKYAWLELIRDMLWSG